MNTALTLVFLLRCWRVFSLPRRLPVSFSTVFSSGTQLLVDEGEDPLHRQNTTGLPPSIQIFSSIPLVQDPQSPHWVLCLIKGLNSPPQDVLWWVNDTPVTSSDAQVSWTWSEEDRDYSATSVLEVSAADWRSSTPYWCGTRQEGRVYGQRLCSGG